MTKEKQLRIRKDRRARRTRARILGTAEKPRLAIFRSNRGMYAQLIDDEAGKTIGSAMMLAKKSAKDGSKTDQAVKVGERIAETAKKAGITKAVFDRRSYQYHGRVKALAEAARKAGLTI